MKISTRVEYGLVALTDIAIYSGQNVTVSVPEIAQRQNISQKYLEQILMLLKQTGFVRAQKGKKGGYALSRPAETILLSDVLNALDSNILADTYAPADNGEEGLRSSVNNCLWNKINCYLRELTGNLTLAEFMEECRSNADSEFFMCNI